MRIDVDYCRVSEDKTGAAAGVESQHGENADFAEECGLTLTRTYTDNDTSAFSGVERPAYERLLADMAAGKVANVVVWHANRLHRSTDEVSAFIRLARENGVRLYSTSKGEAYNLERASGRKQLRDDTSEAEYESEHRGERVALARKRQARNGEYGGGTRPYGWGIDTGRVRSVCVNPKAPPMERVYEDRPVLDMTKHNPAEAEEIRHWKSEILAGVPMGQLLRDIARRGVPTIAMTEGRDLRRRNGQTVKHRGWHAQTIRQILTNPRTSGHAVYQGKIVKRNAYPAIIEDDVRLALITLFSDPARKSSPGNTPKWLGSLIYQCGVCNDGQTMYVRRDTRGVPVYICRVGGHCAWQAERVDAFVESVLVGMLSRADAADLITGGSDVDVKALREEIVVLETMKRDAARSYARKKIDALQLEEITAEVDKQINDIRAELEEATSESPLSDFAVTDDAQRTWDGLGLGRKREVLRHLLTVKLPALGRGRRFNPELIHIDRPQNSLRK
jgi:site-specific DNA recombinase